MAARLAPLATWSRTKADIGVAVALGHERTDVSQVAAGAVSVAFAMTSGGMAASAHSAFVRRCRGNRRPSVVELSWWTAAGCTSAAIAGSFGAYSDAVVHEVHGADLPWPDVVVAAFRLLPGYRQAAGGMTARRGPVASAGDKPRAGRLIRPRRMKRCRA
jgi:hypothetical protein